MNENEKQQIAELVRAKISDLGISVNEFARRNKDIVSSANLSIILSEDKKWKTASISDKLWRSLGNLCGLKNRNWQLVATKNFLKTQSLCEDAQENSRMLALAAFTGAGKTTALKNYAEKNQNVFYVLCTVSMGKRQFLAAMLKSMGVDVEGSIADRLEAIVRRLRMSEKPLLILDDYTKLRDEIKLLVQVIYDETEFLAGIVLAGTEKLKKHIDTAAAKDKLGFRELKCRISYWQHLYRPSRKVVKDICNVNGVDDEKAAETIYNKYVDYRSIRNVIENALRVSARENRPVDAEIIVGLSVQDSMFLDN